MFLAIVLSMGIIYSRKKTITLVIDAKPTKLVTYKKTLAQALQRNNIIIGPKDKVDVSLNSEVTNNDIINIKRAVNVSVAVDGQELNILSAEETLTSMLNAEGIVLNSEDKILPEKESELTDGMKVAITRVETKTFTSSEPIEFSTVIKTDSDMLSVQKKTLQEGKSGEKQITTNVVYEDGEEVSRAVVDETVVSKPVDKIVAQGTVPTLSVSRGGNPVGYTKKLTVRATAYTSAGNSGNARTSSGRSTLRDTTGGYSTIAVDTSVIPYGTKLYIEGYGFAVAADTGSAIKGNTIDVFFNSTSEVYNWGVRYVTAYILK
jgi:uncharacterized protein YabE (DUF348 family)